MVPIPAPRPRSPMKTSTGSASLSLFLSLEFSEFDSLFSCSKRMLLPLRSPKTAMLPLYHCCHSSTFTWQALKFFGFGSSHPLKFQGSTSGDVLGLIGFCAVITVVGVNRSETKPLIRAIIQIIIRMIPNTIQRARRDVIRLSMHFSRSYSESRSMVAITILRQAAAWVRAFNPSPTISGIIRPSRGRAPCNDCLRTRKSSRPSS